MKIYFWCPYLTNIATIESVKKTAIAINKYERPKKKIDLKILNSFGEWSFYKNNLDAIEVINTQKLDLFEQLPKTGLFKSRMTFIIVFLLNFFPLIKIIKKNKPNYLLIHLLTFLPIVLSPILSQNTKIILRISGLPKLTIFRKFIWKFYSNYIYMVTAPTKITAQYLINNNIFPSDKIKLLRDPVISCEKINILKKQKIEKIFMDEKYYLAIGRLTHQKNFSFLINAFGKNINKFSVKKLIIIGDGEEYKNLSDLIKIINAEPYIKLLGFKENIYNYLHNSEGLISTALYEDPGFALIEACYLRKKIITSLVPNGPIEMKNCDNQICFFYQSNNENDFVNKILESEKNIDLNRSLKLALKFSKNFSLFSHFINLRKLIS